MIRMAKDGEKMNDKDGEKSRDGERRGITRMER
jgi:hypothetical protein